VLLVCSVTRSEIVGPQFTETTSLTVVRCHSAIVGSLVMLSSGSKVGLLFTKTKHTKVGPRETVVSLNLHFVWTRSPKVTFILDMLKYYLSLPPLFSPF